MQEESFYNDWYFLTEEFEDAYADVEYDIEKLPNDEAKEIVSIANAERNICNGGFLQFLGNSKLPLCKYASSGYKRIGATRMAAIIDSCLDIMSKYTLPDSYDVFLLQDMVKEDDYTAIMDLSYEFMDYPDNTAKLGIEFYHK